MNNKQTMKQYSQHEAPHPDYYTLHLMPSTLNHPHTPASELSCKMSRRMCFGKVSALEGLHVTGKYRNRSMQHTCSRHAA